MSVSSVEQFKEKQSRREITLYDGLVVEIQNPSLLKMVAQGKIPNPLIPVVAQLMGGKGKTPPKDDDARQLEELKFNANVIEVYTMASLVNPPYEQIGEYLDDRHKSEITEKSMGGLKDIENFSQAADVKE